MRSEPFSFAALALCLAAPSALAQDAEALRAAAAHLRSVQILEANPDLDHDPTTLLVRFRPEASELEKQSARAAIGGARLHAYTTVPGLELVGTSRPVEEAIATLSSAASIVEYAEPNYVVRKAQTIPNDTFFGLQWGIHNTGQSINGVSGTADADIDGVEAWDLTTGSASFKVAIIDSGTQWSHPDLDGNIWSNPGEIAGNGVDDDGNGYVDDVRGWDFYSGDNNPDDTDGHGTHTAGTVGAEGNNGTGVAGVMWQCDLVVLRFLGPQGGFTSDAIAAVEYCTTNNIKVSNNSWGGGGFSSSLNSAINASKSIGHVFVAAAGNYNSNNDSSPFYPASYTQDNIISVAATDNRDNRASFSNYGATSVDIGAPGVDIASTYTGSNYVWNSGTSMASPHVAGVAALVYAQNPGWSYSQVIDRILSTVRPVSSMAGVTTTGGVLDAFAALQGGGGGGDTTPPANPTGLSATAGNGSVGLDWANNGEGDLAGYRVYRSTTSGGPYSAISPLLGTSAYTDNAVTNGTTYYYVVTAEDTSGNESGFSAQASATPTGGGGGGPQVLFSDGFESGNFSAGGWSIQNSNSFISTAASRTGTYGARVRRASWIQRSIDTSGYATIELAYSRRTNGMDSNENLYVEYWTGSSWAAVETTKSTSWADQSFVLPANAGNNPSFAIRFRTNTNRNNERADIDDVSVVGSN